MWLTPVGICSIIIGKILTAENLTVMLAQLSWFILTVVIGVFLYQLIILQVIYVAFVRRNPFSFYFSLAQVRGTLCSKGDAKLFYFIFCRAP